MEDGFEIARGVFGERELAGFREAAEELAEGAGTACVRDVLKKSQVFRALAEDERVKNLIPEGMRPVRGILFDKTRGENWPVTWHQDLTIAVAERKQVDGYGPWSVKQGVCHVQPPISLLEGMVTVRIHLDDTGEDNGALRVVPGSHRHRQISSEERERFANGETCVCACNAGDVLLVSPLILHASFRSKRPGHRRVVHFEYARLEVLDPELRWYEAPG